MKVFGVLILMAFFPLSLIAQQECPVPPIQADPRNIFTPQQEIDLGDILAEQEELDFQLVRDEALNAKLQAIGDRIVKTLPADLPIRFRLSDLPVVNAFTMPGGRIYVTRKLVALADNEDELACILAHEAGHAVAHDSAVSMSLLFKEILGVSSVTSRADIFEKYNRLLDSLNRRRFHIEENENQKQLSADKIAVYSMARAGYDPDVYAQVWDRVAGTGGKTGNWLTDLFGRTDADSKRLREAIKAASELPPQCIGSETKMTDFEQWRKAVIEFSPNKKERAPGLIEHKKLTPPLRADISNLRFSPDGKYILAQDETTIFVLTRSPLAILFRIEAPDAYDAGFTPDGRSVLFYNPKLRIESWDIEKRKRAKVAELALTYACVQTALSPDGKYLSCLDQQFGLRMVEVGTGVTAFERKKFFKPTIYELLALVSANNSDNPDVRLLEMQFSPDAHYFIASRFKTSLALDLATMQPIKMEGEIKKLIRYQFTFVAPDQIIGVAGEKGEKSARASFPSGQIVQKDISLGPADLFAPAKGDYLIVKPLMNYPAGLFDLKQNKVVLGIDTRDLDVYGNVGLFEQRNGELQLRHLKDNKPIETLQLPDSALGRLRAVDVSPDMETLALSQRSRGGIWNLRTNQLIGQVRGFSGVWVDGNRHVYADFPKRKEFKRAISDINLATRNAENLYEIEDAQTGARTWQEGKYLIILKPIRGKDLSKNCDFELRNVATRALLWARHFPHEVPGINVNAAADSVVFIWDTRTRALKDEIKTDPSLKARFEELKEKKSAALLLVLDANNGGERGKVLIDTGKGSFRIARISTVGDWLAVLDTNNRILLYSLASGEQKAVYFGHTVALSPAGNLLLVENEPGRLAAYSLSTSQKVGDYQLPSGTVWMRYSPDGKRLFVLTRAQDIYLIDVSKTTEADKPAGGNR